MSEPSDLELVDRFRRFGDRQAFDRIVERHQSWIRGVCARILRSDDLAQDATQEVFTRALSHLDSWRGENLPGWLKAIAVNCSLTIIERERRWAPLEQVAEALNRLSVLRRRLGWGLSRRIPLRRRLGI